MPEVDPVEHALGRLAEWLEEAYDLRESVSDAFREGESLTDLHKSLLKSRGSVDRLERILTDVTRVRSSLIQRTQDAKAGLDDAWMKAATEHKVGFGTDYASAKERDASHNAKTVGETLEVRKAERAQRQADTVHEIVKILHRGADQSRRDLDAMIRAVSLETRLER